MNLIAKEIINILQTGVCQTKIINSNINITPNHSNNSNNNCIRIIKTNIPTNFHNNSPNKLLVQICLCSKPSINYHPMDRLNNKNPTHSLFQTFFRKDLIKYNNKCNTHHRIHRARHNSLLAIKCNFLRPIIHQECKGCLKNLK